MESTAQSSSPSPSSSIIPFKSKKPLLTTPKKPSSDSHLSPLAVVTPEKSTPVTRIRNQNFALSVSDVRRSALKLRKSHLSGSDSRSGDLICDANELPRSVRAEKRKSPTLPQKYEMLFEFFNAMVSSIRLLRLKRSPSTFTKLCQNIESLTDRRFTLHHLAQLKHVVPEAIEVKKIRVQDEETSCMKEELLITLDTDAIEADENSNGVAKFSHLKGVFRSRIADFSTTHPDGDDIPEGELPHLFYQPKQEAEPSMKQIHTSFSPLFKKRFSSRASNAPVPESSPSKPSSSCLPETPIKETPIKDSSLSNPSSCLLETPMKETPIKEFTSTPAKLASTPARLMAATPALNPPKRSLMSPDHVTMDLPNKSAKRRSLKFEESRCDIEDQPSHVEDSENSAPIQACTASKDVVGVLSEDLLHSLMEKERRIREEQDPVVSQAKTRQQLMAGVPKIFDMIRLLFQSIRSSVITKEELIHKIIAGHLDVVDRREVEEQLKLLQEVAPEYISEKSSLSGNVLIRLNKSSCSESIRAKLLDAK